MASGINRPIGAIEQTLHGYNEGHSLIAGSVRLDEESAALMLIMSDLAPRLSIDPEGWLVGYPLPHAKRYVIARTWPAPEMPRPGCVWTHSLVLDYATVGANGSLYPFLELLQRPRNNFLGYRNALSLPPRQPSAPLRSHLFSDARSVLAELYGTTGTVVREFAKGSEATDLVLALWEQQWSSLRRRFRWTTLNSQPSSEVPKFDLVVSVTKDLAKRGIPRSRSAEQRQAWIVASLADLRAGGGDIRSELWRLSVDVKSGRPAFSLLMSTMLLVKNRVIRPVDAQALISLMGRRLHSDEAKVAKGAILAALLGDPERLDEHSLAFALSLLPSLGEPEALVIARACWRGDQDAFWKLLPQSEAGVTAVNRVLEACPIDELAGAIANSNTDLLLLISQRPDLLRQPVLWKKGTVTTDRLVTIIDQNRCFVLDAVAGMFAAQDLDLARDLTGGQRAAAMFSVYMEWERSQGRSDTKRTDFHREWLATAASDRAATVEYLSGQFRLRPSVVALARALGPRSFPPKRGGSDIWADSWDKCAGRPVSDDREYMAAFFLYRCCHYTSHARTDRFAVAFGALLDAMEEGLRDREARALVFEHFAQYGMFSLLEREVTKVFRGVALLVIANDVPIASFVANARIRHVHGLVDQLQWLSGGRKVMREAIGGLEGRSASKKRIRLLEQALR